MIWGVIALSSLLIGISMAGVVEHSAIHLVYFITPLLVLVLLRHVFLEESSEEPVNRLDARMLWLSGGIIGILLLFYALAYGIDPYDGAVSIGALLLCAGVVLTLFGFLFLHRSNRKTPARQGQAAESVRPPAQGEKETHEDVVEGHEVFEQEYSNLSQVKSLLPLLALLTFAGPVSGALIYFAAFDAFSESYSRYSDDQVLRALDLREAQKTQAFQRFFNADRPGSEEPVLTLGSMAAGSEALDECRGVYLDPGPFFGTTEFDDKSAGNALENTCPRGWIVNSAGVENNPKSEPHPADNWVHWFVQTLPVFSYESGAIKQQKLNQRDAGRLFWCRGENCQGGDQHLTWFTGQLTTRPSFALHWPAADLDYQFMTSSGFGPSYRIAVVSSIVFFLALVAMIQFWIAKTISHHLFGGRIQQVRLARMHLENLRSHRERALVLISPVGVFERVSEQLAPVLPFTPHNWRQFQDRDFAEVANDLGLENDFTIVVDEAEAIFGIEDQRLTLLATLEEAVARGTRVIMLTRVDPFFWLEMLDSRSLFMARTMPIQQTEVLLWCSLMRKFSVGLVADDLFGELSPMEKSREHAQNWAMSTPREKNVLANLAFSDLYNPENLDVIRHLIQRGLVTNSLPHRLREEGFRRYIKGSIELPALSDWRREGDDSVWSAIFPTLLVIIGLLLFFVVSAGQSTVKTAMAMIGTVIAALPVLMSAVAFMRSGRSS